MGRASIAFLVVCALAGCAGSDLPQPHEPSVEPTHEAPPIAAEPVSPPVAPARASATPEAAPKPEPAAPVASTAPVASAEPAASAVASSAPSARPSAPAPELEGTLKMRAGAKVTVELPGDELPAVGRKATLLRQFVQDLGLFKASGWLAIAEVSVVEVTGHRVALKIDAELSQMTVNGRKLDHFKPGQPIRLELAAR